VENVNEEVWVLFKTRVMQKHKKIRSVIGIELTKALELYLEKEGTSKGK
jgi:hypothetical protein